MSATLAGRAAAAGGLGAIGGVGTQALAAGAIGGAGGLLFGLSYGTAIRIGYEQIYPALFPKTDGATPSPNLDQILIKLETLYDFIGGKAAHVFGMEQGLNAAKLANPTVTTLESSHDLESHPAGLTLIETMDNFFRSITPSVAVAYGHSGNANLAETFSIPDPSLSGEPSDAELTTATTAERKTKFINKIRSYSWKTLLAMNNYTTLSTEEKTWVRQFMATPEGQLKAPKIVHKGDTTSSSALTHLAWIQLRNSRITAVMSYANKVRQLEARKDITKSVEASIKEFKLVITQNLSYLRTMSNDYRNPNNNIAKDAITLRQWLSNYSQTGKFI